MPTTVAHSCEIDLRTQERQFAAVTVTCARSDVGPTAPSRPRQSEQLAGARPESVGYGQGFVPREQQTGSVVYATDYRLTTGQSETRPYDPHVSVSADCLPVGTLLSPLVTASDAREGGPESTLVVRAVSLSWSCWPR
jgi:hypothetical protein